MRILEDILAVKREEVRQLHRQYSRQSFSNFEFFSERNLSLAKALRNEGRISIIAEIKKASPSKGVLREDFDHLAIAKTYFQHGANAISVLTDRLFFHGEIRYLNEIARFKTAPLLRKDFIIDEYQIFEAKANGADAILLITEALSAQQIDELSAAAREVGLEALIEMHSVDQLDKIDLDKNRVIGINNRNLQDFSTNVRTTVEIAARIPNQNILVSESGVSSETEINMIRPAGADAILIGEYLMKAESISDALDCLREWCVNES